MHSNASRPPAHSNSVGSSAIQENLTASQQVRASPNPEGDARKGSYRSRSVPCSHSFCSGVSGTSKPLAWDTATHASSSVKPTLASRPAGRREDRPIPIRQWIATCGPRRMALPSSSRTSQNSPRWGKPRSGRARVRHRNPTLWACCLVPVRGPRSPSARRRVHPLRHALMRPFRRTTLRPSLAIPLGISYRFQIGQRADRNSVVMPGCEPVVATTVPPPGGRLLSGERGRFARVVRFKAIPKPCREAGDSRPLTSYGNVHHTVAWRSVPF